MSLVTGLARLPGRILWSVHMRNLSPVDRDEFKKHTQNGGAQTCTVRDCQSKNKANSHTPKEEIHICKTKIIPFWPLCCESKAILIKKFRSVTGLECLYGKIFIPVTEISVAKTKISVSGPAEPLI